MAAIGRNQPCPCGSGKKYKACCLGRSDAKPARNSPAGPFRLEAGSYGGPGGGYAASIACYKQTGPEDWDYHFVLVRPESVWATEDEAVNQASEDLAAAHQVKAERGTDEALALFLRSLGYWNVPDFQLARDPDERTER